MQQELRPHYPNTELYDDGQLRHCTTPEPLPLRLRSSLTLTQPISQFKTTVDIFTTELYLPTTYFSLFSPLITTTQIFTMFRTQLARQVRLFSTSPIARKSPVETIKDAAKVVDRTISNAAVKGIETGGM